MGLQTGRHEIVGTFSSSVRREDQLTFYRMYITDFFSVDVDIDVNINFYLNILALSVSCFFLVHLL